MSEFPNYDALPVVSSNSITTPTIILLETSAEYLRGFSAGVAWQKRNGWIGPINENAVLRDKESDGDGL